MVPECSVCGGTLKPDVVFFGANVASSVVQDAYAAVESCDSMIVVGSSLHVWSGFRFVKRAVELNKRVLVVNMGETRADELPGVMKVEEDCTDFLPSLQEAMQ